jgi:predicted phosphodiesterase
MFFLGDFCAPFTLAQIADGFAGPVDAVFGNNDGDPFLLGKVAAGHSHVTLHGQLAEIEVAGVAVALNHYPEIARRLAESGAYRAVFSGHDHRRYVHQVGPALWANPGEVMGRYGSPGFGVFDAAAGTFAHHDI